jgi:hypothetical protein
MQTTFILKKGLVVGITTLFVGINSIPIQSVSIERLSMMKQTGPWDVNWTINGTIGENGWFVSPVNFTCTYDHEHIASVYYKIHASEEWQLYAEPFTVYEGIVEFYWYFIDYQGNVETPHGPFAFGIDYTPPIIIDFTFARAGFFKCKFNASVSDYTSGINHVEFWLDDQFIGNCSTYPYFIYWRHSMFLYMLRGFILYHTFRHNPQCIVYDNAGNYCISPSIS